MERPAPPASESARIPTDDPADSAVSARGTLRSAAVVSAGTLLSRVLGLVRDVLTATFFGMSGAMDAFFIAFMVPNLFRKLFGEGALSAAFIPVLTDYKEHKSKADAARLVSVVGTWLALFLGAITVVAIAVVWLTPASLAGFADEPDKWEHLRLYFTILFPLVVFMCLSALQAGVLNTYGRFATPALMPALHNVIWIAAIYLAVLAAPLGESLAMRVAVMCIGILLGGILQWAVQVAGVRRAGLSVRPMLVRGEPGVRELRHAMLPVLFPIAVFQINTLLDLLLAEWLIPGEDAVSAYSYANRLYQFPFGIVGIALATAVFPMLARYASRGEDSKVTGGLLNGLRLLAFIVLPAAAGLIALNDDIVMVVYRHGAFTLEDAQRTADVLLFFSLALPAVCALQMLNKAFFALKDTRTPMWVALASVAVNLGCNLVLVQTDMREAGLAAGTGISALFNVVVLSLLLARRLRGTLVNSSRLMAAAVSDRLAAPVSAGGLRRFWLSLLRSGAASAGMGFAVFYLMRELPTVNGGTGGDIVIVFAGIAAGAASYAVLSLLLRSQEMHELLGSLRRRA